MTDKRQYAELDALIFLASALTDDALAYRVSCIADGEQASGFSRGERSVFLHEAARRLQRYGEDRSDADRIIAARERQDEQRYAPETSDDADALCTHRGEQTTRIATGYLYDEPRGTVQTLCVDCGEVIEDHGPDPR